MTTPGFLGGTTERMRALSTQMTGGADQITAVKVRATKAVHALEWLGSDQASFLQAWLSTYGPMIEKISSALTTAAQSVRSQGRGVRHLAGQARLPLRGAAGGDDAGWQGLRHRLEGLATSDPDGFAKAQFDFIKQTHFDPAMKETYARIPGLSLEGRSPVLAETLFSTTVQHRMNTDVIVSRALAGKDVASMTDAQIISAVYNERGRGDGSVYFRSSPASTQHNIAERFEREKAQALQMLQGR